MNNFWQDLRYGAQILLKKPGITALAVITLGLAIGANTTIFTWIKGVMLNPLPGVRNSNRLLTINGVQGEQSGISNSYNSYEYFRDHNSVFTGLIAYEMLPVNLGEGGRPEVLMGGIVSGNFFEVLGIEPILGRTFLPEEDRTRNTHPVTVISHTLWQRRFGSDPNIVGKTISLNDHAFTVIGIAPPGFFGTYGGLAQLLWVPLQMHSQLLPGGERLDSSAWLQIMGKLKPDLSQQQAQSEMSVLAAQFAEGRPEVKKGWTVRTYTLTESQRGIQSALSPILQILMAIIGLVLLIACANVASLLLARAVSRRKEIAIRLALGGSRARLIRQLLTESFLLALPGGALGLLIALWSGELFNAVIPSFGPVSLGFDMATDYRVLLFTLAVTLITSVIFGLAPALQASNPNIMETLTQETAAAGGGHSRSRLLSVLVVVQIALSCIALIGAGLFIQSLRASLSADPGFDVNHVAIATTDLFLNGYDEAKGKEFYNRLIERLESVPGVESASYSSYVPMSLGGGGNLRSIYFEGYTPPPDGPPTINITTDVIGPDYLRTMGISLREGREFSLHDREGAAPVAIINETMARRFWPDESAVGKRLRVGQTWHEIVGVSGDAVYRSFGQSPHSLMYLPALQNYQSQYTLAVRTGGDPAITLPLIQNTVRDLDANVALIGLSTMKDHARVSLFPQRTAASLLGVFGLLALILAMAGLYGVMSYKVSQHTREIGIRRALGAQTTNIIRLIVGQGMILTGMGVLIGLASAFVLTRLMSSLLFGVSPTDLTTFAVIGILLIVVALAASFFPARRAAATDPMVALRHE